MSLVSTIVDSSEAVTYGFTDTYSATVRHWLTAMTQLQ